MMGKGGVVMRLLWYGERWCSDGAIGERWCGVMMGKDGRVIGLSRYGEGWCGDGAIKVWVNGVW